MRKGRSSRKSRVSRPPVTAKPPAVDAHATLNPAPQVVIGLTVPPSEPIVSARGEADPTKLDVAGQAALDVAREVEPAPEPSSEPPPPESEKRIATARPIDEEEPSAVAEPEPMEAAAGANADEAGGAPDAAETSAEADEPKAEGEPEARTAETEAPKPAEEATEVPDVAARGSKEREAGDEWEEQTGAEIVDLKALDSSKAALASAAVEEPEPEPESAVDETPPAVAGPIDVAAEKFFSEGELSRHGADDDHDEVMPEKVKRKASPQVVERRARFARYVTWAVGVSAVVCLAALARTALTRSASVETPARAAVATMEAPTVKEATEPTAAPAPQPPVEDKAAAAEPPPVGATSAEVKPEEPKAEEPQAVKPAEGATDTAEPTAEGADAKEEKASSRRALERGKLADAIEAGERSVKLDPTDSEAWLILGAAYQTKGNLAEARRCYTSCLKEGKTARRAECAAMLR